MFFFKDWIVESDDPSPGTSSEMSKTVNLSAMYNWKPFNCKQIERTELRKKWELWIRGLENLLKVSKITDPEEKKLQLLTLGGLELTEVFYELPGTETDSKEAGLDHYQLAVDKLTAYFAPKHHEAFERHLFWQLKPDEEEPLEKFILRVQKQATKCDFGTNVSTAKEKSVLDKIIQCAPIKLKNKLLEKEDLTLDKAISMVNSFQSVNYQSREMSKGPGNLSDVNRVYSRPQRPTFRQNQSQGYSHNNACYRCGSFYHKGNDNQCPALRKFCMSCGRKGHFSRFCNKRTNDNYLANQNHPKRQRVNMIEDEEQNYHHDVCSINGAGEKFICSVGGINIEMIIDSGSRFNIIDKATWSFMKANGLRMSNQRNNAVKFKAYGSHPLKVLTVFDASIEVRDVNGVLRDQATFYVIDQGQEPLLGKETAEKLGVLVIGLPSSRQGHVYNVSSCNSPFPKMKGVKIKLDIDLSVKPSSLPLRSIPVSLEEQIKAKILEMEQQEIIEKVQGYSEWSSPMVPVFKDNGEVRICIDMRKPNKAIKRAEYPLPTIDGMLPHFRGAKFFTTLDIKQAFFQLELHEDSRYITTFKTPWGQYRFNRLIFGVNCAPELFQKTLDNLLSGIENVVIFIDDILVWGETEEIHDKKLNAVLERLKSFDVLLNSQKCKYKQRKVRFLGYDLSEKGIEPTNEKIAAVQRFRTPETKEEVRSFLGLVTFVGRFIPDLSTLNEPLRRLIRKDKTFSWGEEQQAAFVKIKEWMTDINSLKFFDKDLKTRLIADASPVGVGCVLIQFYNEEPRVIGYAAKSLTDIEMRYCQTEREALSLVWGVERFSHYLLGMEFELETDHKALEFLFGDSSKPCARIERWVLRYLSFVQISKIFMNNFNFFCLFIQITNLQI